MAKARCSPFPLLLLLAALGAPAGAQDRRDSGPLPQVVHDKVRSSPFDAPEKNDRTFVVDDGALLDTGCIYRSQGPIVFQIPVTRVVGELNPDGTLKNAAQMVQAGVLSAKATLFMPVYDVDSGADTTPPEDPEVDIVSFNGHQIGTLSGENDVWKLNSFQIPIEYVKFPPRAPFGITPFAVMNEVRIDLDQGNVDIGEQVWCTAVDWGAETFSAMSPILLIHGNNSDGGFFDRQGFTAALKAKNLLYDNSIGLPTETIVSNGRDLDLFIPQLVKSFGVDSVHLIAHSKGGLDSREYLAHYQPAHEDNFKVLSLTTLSTPHNGSELADLLVVRKAEARKGAVELSGFPSYANILTALASLDIGTTNLTPAFVASFNADNVPSLAASDIVFNTVAANADTNGNAQIDRHPDEYDALRKEDWRLRAIDLVSEDTGRQMVDAPYQILRNTASIQVSTRVEYIEDPDFGPIPVRIATLTSVPNPTPLGNDVLVTIPSGLGVGSIAALVRNSSIFSGTSGRNHSSVADGGVAATVIPWLIGIERARGDLK